MHIRPLSAVLAFAIAVPVSALAQDASSPVIAVAAEGTSSASAVAPQLGRSPYFLLYAPQGKLVEAIPNPYKDTGNAGIPAVALLAGKGVKVVVAEGFGGQITSVIKDNGMRPLAFSGSASDAAAAALKP